jgi:nitrate/nitrite-specific signal transduction histidine kinase
MDLTEYQSLYKRIMVTEKTEVSLGQDERELDLIYQLMNEDEKRSLSRDTARTIIKSYFTGKETRSQELYQDAIRNTPIPGQQQPESA